jgi:hypothetical protein
MNTKTVLATACIIALATPAAAHKLRDAGVTADVADGAFSVTPGQTWNRLQQSEGKYQEVWSIDGRQLNRISFYGGVPIGEPLIKERSKKRDPLPKVTDTMLLPDIPGLLERTYRTQYGIPSFDVGNQEPAQLGGKPGIHFEYSYVDPNDEVERKGDAYAALQEGKLYLVTYEAPALYFFDHHVAEARKIFVSLRLRS